MNDDRMPVLVGGGQVTDKNSDPETAKSPMDLMVQACDRAMDSACGDPSKLRDVQSLVVVDPLRRYTPNAPETLAHHIGASSAQTAAVPASGNMPQALVNEFCERISAGELEIVLIAGTEAMATGRKIVKSGSKPDWGEGPDTPARYLYEFPDFSSDHESRHGIFQAAHAYPLYENALRGHYGNSIEAHQRQLGELFARFSEVSETNPHAWYPQRRSAAEIATPSPGNRYVGWPYTKFMNAMNQVNQSGAIVLMSAGYAKRLGILEERWVYLHGCADANEPWLISDRRDYFSSPAIEVMARETLKMAGRGIDQIDFLDLYACFPCAVEIARDEFGIARDDPRYLTITGGLPYAGGAGSYVVNSIAAMIESLQENPGKFGLITGNGGLLTKHSAGIYSTTRPASPTGSDRPWVRIDPKSYQAEVDAVERPPFTETPSGDSVIETYTVVFGRDEEPIHGTVIGRMGSPDGTRFVSRLPDDAALMKEMTKADHLGARGVVHSEDGINIFRPS